MNKFFKIILPILFILLFLASYLHPTSELFIDLGEHILKGQLFIETHKIPVTNIFSYTYPNFYFVNLEWLIETAYYLVNLYFGLNGLIIGTGLMAISAMAVLYRYVTKRADFLFVGYACFLYVLMLSERADVLPEVFCYLFVALFVVLLYKFREKDTKLIWLLIPLQLLWVNSHIYFIIGILLVFLFLMEALILFKDRDGGKYVRNLSIILGANCLVSLINPYGIKGFLFPLLFWQNYSFPVTENSNIFHNFSLHPGTISVSVLVYEILSVSLIAAIIFQIKKARMIDAFISVIFIAGTALAFRNLVLFVFATFVPFVFLVGPLLQKYIKKIDNILTFLLPVLIIGFSAMMLAQLGAPGLGMSHRTENAVDFFINSKLAGPIFNNYDIGSYLAYRLYPKERVFVDTRPEAYPASFFQSVYFPMLQNLQDFEGADKKYHFNTIIYGFTKGEPLDAGLIKYLLGSKDWKLVYLDDMTIIFVKNNKNNDEIIKKHTITNDNFRFPKDTSFKSLYDLAHFLDLMGWKKAEIKVAQKMLESDPHNCTVLRNLGLILGSKDPAALPYITDYYLYCRK